MKKILLATAAVATIATMSTPAFASSTDQKQFQVKASVPQECSLQNPGTFNLGKMPIDKAPGANALLMTNVVGKTKQLWMSCNYAATISINSVNGALKTDNPVTDTANFKNTINYRIILLPSVANAFTGFGSYATWTTHTKTQAQAHEFHNQANLTVQTATVGEQHGLRPVAGDYSDTVTISLGAV